MSRRRKNRQTPQPQPYATPLAYSIQVTPQVLRDLAAASKHLPGGAWDFIKTLAEGVYPSFTDKDFRPLIMGTNGVPRCDGLGPDDKVKVFMASLAGIENCPDRAIMIVPYLDKDKIKVLYFKWTDETFYDSFTVPDGQNRVWKNEEKL